MSEPLARSRAHLRRPQEERFWEKVDRRGPDECWPWTGYLHPHGAGLFWNTERLVQSHRWAYEHLVGPIPEGLHLDHLCRNRACVNPAHLEPVTNQENTIRGFKSRGSDEHCRNGHPRTPENTYVYPSGERSCRECKRIRDRRSS